MPDVKLAAVYLRVSTDDQVELSPDSQLQEIRSWAGAHGYLIPDDFVFVDDGISGRSAKKRPGFNAMIAAAKQEPRPFDAVLLWKFSRFARNQEESVLYKAMLRRGGVDVISVSEPVADGPFGDLIERIIEWMDEYYSIRLAGEVKRSMTLNAQRGRRQIAPPFGYTLSPADAEGRRKMLPEPTEAPLVQEVFSRFIGGEGLFPIAKWLNSLGVRTHRGGSMENRTVEYMLRNPVYIGKIRWTPTGRARRDFDNPDTIVADGDHEAIIDEATWEAAQARMRAVKEQWGYKARPTYELKDWMGGVVRCAECGGTLIFSQPHFFKCNNYARGRCRSSQHIRVDLLHEALLERLRSDLAHAGALRYELTVTPDSGGDEINRLEQVLEGLDRKLARVRDAYASGIDTIEEYRQFRSEIDAEKAAARSRLEELRAALDPVDAEARLRSALAAALETLEAPDATKEQKNNALRSIVHSLTFSKSRMSLEIIYRVSI